MIELKPIFLISGTASGVVAPPQATVVSSLAKLLAPGTVGFVTCCAPAGWAAHIAMTRNANGRIMRIGCTPSGKATLILL